MFACDGPLMPPLKPRDDGVIVVISYQGISKNGVRCPPANGLLNGRSHGKIHVSHPEGNELFLGGRTAERSISTRGFFVPLDAARAATLYPFVKVILHAFFSLMTLRQNHKAHYLRVSMMQLFGWRTFSSMVTLPMLSATICPEVGFLIFVICPRISA